MSTEAGFLADIVTNPDDDTPRLIFADWLEDNGDPQRANLIRAQCKLAALEPYDPARLEAEDEEQDLLAGNRQGLEASVPEAVRASIVWRRGLPYGVATTGAKFLRNAKKLFTTSPLESLSLESPEKSLDEVAQSKWLTRLRDLTAIFTRTGEESRALQRLLASTWLTGLRGLALLNLGPAPGGALQTGAQLANWPGLPGLRRLTLRGSTLDEADLRHLTAASNLGPIEAIDLLHTNLEPHHLQPLLRCDKLALRELDLAYNYSLGTDAARMLAESSHLSGLRQLRIDSTNLMLRGVRALAQSPHLAGLHSLIIGGNVQEADGAAAATALATGRMTNLRHLDLASCWVADRGVTAIAKSEAMAGLANLQLEANRITNAGAMALAASPHLGRLQKLGLPFNPIDAAGVLALLDSPTLLGLRCLSLTSNPLDANAAERLASCAGLSRLRRLEMDRCPLYVEGMTALAASPHVAGLTHLSLLGCGISNEGAIALARSPYLTNLRELTLSANGITVQGVQALADSPQLSRLRVLRLSHNGVGREAALALARSPYLNRLTVLELPSGLDRQGKAALRERFGSAVQCR